MLAAPIPDNDEERLASLDRMALLSTPREADLDRIVRLAHQYFRVDISLVSLIDRERQWFKARCGLDDPETGRDISFCGHAIMSDEPFIVTDASQDERFFDNPLVTGDPHIRFYAGQPLSNGEGQRIGTLCIIAKTPRSLSDQERETLQDLGRIVELVLQNRELSEAQRRMIEALEKAERDRRLDPLTGLWNRRGLDDLLHYEIERAAREDAPLSLAMIDIDHFKVINDSYGHPIGDEAIKLMSRILVDSVRAIDSVARFGGEEFVVILPNLHPLDLPKIGDKLLATIRRKAILTIGDGTHKFTASIGLTGSSAAKSNPMRAANLIETADQALYKAKQEGRNRYNLSGAAELAMTEFPLV